MRRSLDDARREHEAGDLSDEDHDLLVAGTRPGWPGAGGAGALGPVPPRRRTPRRRRPTAGRRRGGGAGRLDTATHGALAQGGIAGSCLLIVAGVVILVVHFVQARQPGQASSGSISVPQAQQIEQQLSEANSLNNAGGAKNEEAALEPLQRRVWPRTRRTPTHWPARAGSCGTWGRPRTRRRW